MRTREFPITFRKGRETPPDGYPRLAYCSYQGAYCWTAAAGVCTCHAAADVPRFWRLLSPGEVVTELRPAVSDGRWVWRLTIWQGGSTGPGDLAGSCPAGKIPALFPS